MLLFKFGWFLYWNCQLSGIQAGMLLFKFGGFFILKLSTFRYSGRHAASVFQCDSQSQHTNAVLYLSRTMQHYWQSQHSKALGNNSVPFWLVNLIFESPSEMSKLQYTLHGYKGKNDMKNSVVIPFCTKYFLRRNTQIDIQ